jgi:hypothetical protein
MPMKRTSQFVVATLACVFALSARAEDGEKKVVVKEEKVKVEKKETETKEVKKEVKKEEERGGSKFTNFWVHTVGGTIGNGLKKGAGKIANTFD